MQIIFHVLDNPFDRDEPLSLEESDLVKGILKLADDLQTELYRRDGEYISAQGKTIFDRIYRELRKTVQTYLGDDRCVTCGRPKGECSQLKPHKYERDEHGLYYDPKPGMPFPKKEGQ